MGSGRPVAAPRRAQYGGGHDPRPPRSAPLARHLAGLPAFRLSGSNRLALSFDPFRDGVPFTFGVEIFDAGHVTPTHSHPTGHELFFVLEGGGNARCNGNLSPLGPGDVVILPPRLAHGLDAGAAGRMACLELLVPADGFEAEVRRGGAVGRLADDELCALAAVGCG